MAEIAREIIFERVDEEQSYEEEMNSGQPITAARVEVGSEERRKKPMTTKINRPDLGLMMIAEGAEPGLGRIGATLALKQFGEMLGEALDERIENNNRTDGTEQERLRHIDALIRSEIEAAFEALGDSLGLQATIIEGVDRFRVRTAVVKQVELPGGQQRIYVGSLGDCRVYIERGDTLTQVSKDDTILQAQVDDGFISEDDFQRIDQASNPLELDEADQKWAGLAGNPEAVDSTKKNQLPRVKAFDVQPGDRVIVVNGGLQKNLLTSEMQRVLDRGISDKATERQLQQDADRFVGSKNPRERTQARDLAASVYTIPEHRMLSGAEKLLREREQATKTLEATTEHHGGEMLRLRQLAFELRQRAEGPDQPELLRDRLSIQVEQAKVQKEADSHAYQRAEAELRMIDLNIPPKLALGGMVVLERPSGRDDTEVLAQVVAYDEEAHEYILNGPNGEVRKSRAVIETIQPDALPSPGDRLVLKSRETGRLEPGYEVKGFRKDGNIELLVHLPDGSAIRQTRHIDEVLEGMRNQLRHSERDFIERQKAHEGYIDNHRLMARQEQRLKQILEREAKNRAKFALDNAAD